MMKVFLATIWCAALLIAVGSALQNDINLSPDVNFSAGSTTTGEIQDKNLQDAELNGEQTTDQINDDLDSALELMKKFKEKTRLEQKTTKANDTKNKIMESNAHEKMRGLRKLASTEMKKSTKKISKDQNHRGVLKDLANYGTVKKQWGVFRKIGRSFKRVGRRVWRKVRRVGRRVWRKARRVGRRVWRKVRRVGRRVWRKVRRVGRRVWRKVRRVGRRVWRKVRRVGRRVWRRVKRVGRRVWRRVKRVGRKVWRKVKRVGRKAWRKVKRVGRKVWRKVKRVAGRAWKGIKKVGKFAIKVAKSPIGQMLIQGGLTAFGVPPMLSGAVLGMINGQNPIQAIAGGLIPGGGGILGSLGGKLLGKYGGRLLGKYGTKLLGKTAGKFLGKYGGDILGNLGMGSPNYPGGEPPGYGQAGGSMQYPYYGQQY